MGMIVASSASNSTASEQAQKILDYADVAGGVVVHLDCEDAEFTTVLRKSDAYLVHGLCRDRATLAEMREQIQSAGNYGPVSADFWPGGELPYADNLVSLIVVDDPKATSTNELIRVLRPGGVTMLRGGSPSDNGRAMLNDLPANDELFHVEEVSLSGKQSWVKLVKRWPREIDCWGHFLHGSDGNPVAKDSVVGPPRRLQWVAGPRWSKNHETDASVSAVVSSGGRIFTIVDEAPTGVVDERLPDRWALIARDAFSGVILWKRPIEAWGWREWKTTWHDWKKAPVQLPRRLVATDDRVYVTLGFNAPLAALDAATGKTVREYKNTRFTDEIVYCDGILVLSVNRAARSPDDAGSAGEKKQIVALQADTGEVLWTRSNYRGVDAVVGTVSGAKQFAHAIRDGRVCLLDAEAVVCIELESGKELWRAEQPPVGRKRSREPRAPLIITEEVVLFVAPTGNLAALDKTDGSRRWHSPLADLKFRQLPTDVYVARGLVWVYREDMSFAGLDLKTGEVRQEISASNVLTTGHHHRCYRNRATERYILTGRRGVEFIDLEGGENHIHNWVRGTCYFGVLPCNGLLYAPPHPCRCYVHAKLSGFYALATRMEEQQKSQTTQQQLDKGPAYGKFKTETSRSSTGADWPTYRHDSLRSGTTPIGIPANLKRSWSVDLGGKLTSPVVTGGRAYVAVVDRHTLYALDSNSGTKQWSFTAGGRIDTPPTISRGRVLFGCADGWAYCLRPVDGQLIWRFRGAQKDRRVVACGQIESAWPIHGNILVKDDFTTDSEQAVAYFAAGRSSFLDGGIRVYGLDVATGQKLYETVLDGPHLDATKIERNHPHSMAGALSDVLVSDGKSLYMRHVKFDWQLKAEEIRKEIGFVDATDRRKENVGRIWAMPGPGPRLYASSGFLDDSMFNRTFWSFGDNRGRLLVFGQSATYGVLAYDWVPGVKFSPMFFPNREGYLLFRDERRESKDQLGAMIPFDRETKGFSWHQRIPVLVRAMVLAGDTLFVAGPPDVVYANDPLMALEARTDGCLWAASAATGKVLGRYALEAPPVFDGMIAANERLYVSTASGKLSCLAGE